MSLTRTDCEGFYRRDFLKLGTTGLLGLGLADLLRLEARAKADTSANESSKPKAKWGILISLAGGPGYLGTGYTPFFVEGVAGGGKAGAKANLNLRVRGIQLPNGFSLEDLAKRDDLLRQFDQGFRKLDGAGDLVDGLDEFHRQALDILRSDKTKKAFNLNQESEATRERYRTTGLGIGALA